MSKRMTFEIQTSDVHKAFIPSSLGQADKNQSYYIWIKTVTKRDNLKHLHQCHRFWNIILHSILKWPTFKSTHLGPSKNLQGRRKQNL